MSEIKTVEQPLHLDDVLLKFRLSSSYYVGFICMISLLYMNDSFTCTDYIFTTEKVKYWCVDDRFKNDSCAGLSNSTEVCTEWVYDNPRSFVAEFQLACQEWKRTLVGTVQSFGYGAGLLIIGPLSDRFGRKRLIVMTAVTSAVMGVARSFSNNYWVFIILIILGSALGQVNSPAYILVNEMVAHEKRVLINVLCSAGSCLSHTILSLAAFFFPNWRHLLLVLYAPAFIFVSYILLLDESPRWLLSKGRKDEVMAILERTAKTSKVELERNTFQNFTYECRKDEEISLIITLKKTFTSGVLVKRLFMCLSWWIASTFVNYGIRIHSVSIPGNKYINFGIMGILTLPARLLTFWLLRRFTRKTSLFGTFFVCALVCIAQPFVPDNLTWLSIVLFMVGNVLMTVFFSVTYIFTSELFPTRTRNSMHALCSSLGRIGSIIAPQTPLLMVYWHGLPSLTFGAVSLLAGVVALFAPSTADDALPDTVSQAEAIGQTRPQHADDNLHDTNELNGIRKGDEQTEITGHTHKSTTEGVRVS